jgi:hypothetical protein
MSIKKQFLSIVGSVIFIIISILLSGCGVKGTRLTVIQPNGYSDYVVLIPRGWVKTSRVLIPAFEKKFSKNLPDSNINIQCQKLNAMGIVDDITRNEYVSKYLIPSLKNRFNENIIDESAFDVNKIPAIKLKHVRLLSINNVSREIYGETIVFLIDGFVYTCTLGSFKPDFDRASAEFESIIKSIIFKKDV